MANQLTGGFDVVAEFSLGAVNRVLAAMHRGGRLQHSLSVRVDNTPRSLGTFGVVTEFGEATTSRLAVAQGTRGTTGAATSSTAVARLLTQVLDPIVNAGTLQIVPPVAHPLHGVAQLQLGSPTITLPANKHTQATVHIPLMAQYFPDQNSTVLPRFLAGELQITFAATHVNSNAGKFIHIDLPSIAGISTGSVHFQPSQFLDQDSIASIDAALRHALSTAFEPSNTAIPSSLTDLQIFTLPQQGVVAVLMNLPGGQPPIPPGNFNSVFLNPADQFALAIGSEFLTSAILDPINQALEQNRHQHFSYSIDWVFTTSHYDVNIDINSVTLEFQDGRIVVTLKVHIDAEVPGPDQSDTITAKQAFALNLNNGVVTLVRQGDVDVDNSSIIFQIVDSLFGSIKSRVRNAFLSAWNSHQSEIQSKVRSKLSSSVLQGFVQKLMNPETTQTPPPQIVNPTLAFTSIEIRKAGVVVHGTLAVPPWPAPNVEFDLVPNTATMQHPEYNALKSWIPGGTIKDYVWSYTGQARPADATKFLSTDAPAISSFAIFGSVCVKAEGTRISPSGPVVMQPVSLKVCHGMLSGNAASKLQGPLPDIGVNSGSNGQLVIGGHVSPWSPAGARAGTVNLLIHFPSDKSFARLAELPRLLKSAKRPDADTGIIGVLTAAQIPKTKDPGGMAFADDAEGWEKYLSVKRRPATVLLGPDGDVLWRQDGDVEGREITAALNKHLSARSYFTPRLLRMPLKQGLRAPNFVFQYSEGREVTLRKLAGRRAVLIFFKNSSKASTDTIATIEKTLSKVTGGVAILAIDGSSGEAKKLRATSTKPSSLTIIPDPLHKISDAYGVSVWPTTIMVDEAGVMQQILYGSLTAKDLGPPAGLE